MALELTTPANGGVVTDGETYTHLKVVYFSIDVEHAQITIVVIYGNVVESKFQRSSYRALKKELVIDGDDYTTIATTTASAAGIKVFKEVQDAIYQWLIDNGHADGTIE